MAWVRTEALSWQRIALAGTVFLAALALFGGLAQYFGIIAMWMPLVNSIALVVATPRLPSAHPWPIVAGHAATAIVGSLAGHLFGASVAVAIVAATLGLLLMLIGRAMHPPAAATGLIFTLHPVPPQLAVPLLIVGASGIAALGALMRRADRP